MSDDLVSRLRKQASSDHVRGCRGRQYSCDCGYDIRGEGLLEQAATALTEARAEIERLRAGINGIVNCQGPMTRAQVREACAEILDNKTVGLDNQSPFAAALGDWKVRATTMEISVKEAARSMHKLMTRALTAESSRDAAVEAAYEDAARIALETPMGMENHPQKIAAAIRSRAQTAREDGAVSP